jgi:hypothetical protein
VKIERERALKVHVSFLFSFLSFPLFSSLFFFSERARQRVAMVAGLLGNATGLWGDLTVRGS